MCVEDLKQLNVGGDQGDEVAFLLALELGGGKAAHGGKDLVAHKRQHPEGQVVIAQLLGIAQGSTCNAARDGGHGCDARSNPTRLTLKVEQGRGGKDRDADCGKEAGDTEHDGASEHTQQGTGELHELEHHANLAKFGGRGTHARNRLLRRRIVGRLARLLNGLLACTFATASREVLKLCLTRPKARVGTVLFCKLLVGPRLHDAAGLEDVHLVAAAQGSQAVRHHDDGLGARKLGHGIDDCGLAICVDVGSCLVEDVDRRVMQQGACHGEALALATREVRALGADGGVQAAAATHEIVDTAAAESLPQLIVVCPGAGHQQVRAHGAGKEEAAKAHVGHRVAQAFGRNVAQVDAADCDAAGIAEVGACEDAGQG